MKIAVKVKHGKRVTELENDHLVVYTDKKRENNMANRSVIKQVAAFYGVNSSSVRIVKGHASKNKILDVDLVDHSQAP